MKKTLFSIFIILFVALKFSAAQIIFDEPLSQRIANYNIKVELNTETKKIDGQMTLEWLNTTNDTIGELCFHLYLNAFKNHQSTFMRESGGQLRGDYIDEDDNNSWGWIEINTMRSDGQNLLPKMQYVQPDNFDKSDMTVIRIPLKDSIYPNRKKIIDIDFTSKLPKIFARSGYSDDYFLVAQWFPKIGVYDSIATPNNQTGKWNCHQYHANSEFFADFGVYDVEITLPKKYIVGATGKLQSQKKTANLKKTLIYRAEDVIDFAWTASPLFETKTDKWEHVNINLLIQPEHEEYTSKYLNSVKHALQYFNDNLGKYPYDHLTIVDPPFRASGSGGMEYPTFITGNALWGVSDKIGITEKVTIHEFGHQYFMGLLATNEFEEPWLDEGINTYFESRIMDYVYDENSSFIDFAGIQAGDFEFQRGSYTGYKNPKIAESFRKAWEFNNGGYGVLNYQKVSVWLTTLDRLIGRETMDEIMKTYFEKWKFKHPKTDDFIEIVNSIVAKNHGNKFGNNMNWFFDQVLYGSDICDYKLESILNHKIKNNEETDSIDKYNSKVVLYRLGEVIMPVELQIEFEDGSKETKIWDGKSRTHEFYFDDCKRIITAEIDPERKIAIDMNFNNNSITLEPEQAPFWKYTLKFLFWIQNIIQTFSIFV